MDLGSFHHIASAASAKELPLISSLALSFSPLELVIYF